MVKPLTFKGDKKPKKRKRPAEESKPLSAEAEGEDDTGAVAREDDSWVSAEAILDIAGPIMLVLPTEETPCSLACDSSGKVFAQPIENIVDGNPASAEPHDVRQVWLASQIVGSTLFCFKGHNGKFLGCRLGVLSATSDAVAEPESFVVLADSPGIFRLQASEGTFITTRESAPSGSKTDAGPQVRGDGPPETPAGSPLRIRMQARFKPRIKASKEEKAREKISRRELEDAVGRRLDDDEVKSLKRARREGDYHERLLDLKVKSKHDKYG